MFERRTKLKLKVNILFSDMSYQSTQWYQPNVPIEQLWRYGFYTYIHSLISAPETIMRYLCKIYRLHKIPVGDDTVNENFEDILKSVTVFYSVGTFQIHGRSLIKDVLDYALAAGYRQIDTAAVYGNEVDIGNALKILLPKYKLKREDIFITSKLSPSDQGNKAYAALQESIKNLSCSYLDLFLIHWPGAGRIPINSPENAKLRSASWESLAKGVKDGLVRDIGVSNYTVRHLQELLEHDSGVQPAVNQVEYHPHYHDSELKKFCESKGILLQAYSSLGGSNNPNLINDQTVLEIARNNKKSPAQVLLRWALQQGIGIIPKAVSKERIEANIELNFSLSNEDMNILGSLKKKEKYAWDPKNVA